MEPTRSNQKTARAPLAREGCLGGDDFTGKNGEKTMGKWWVHPKLKTPLEKIEENDDWSMSSRIFDDTTELIHSLDRIYGGVWGLRPHQGNRATFNAPNHFGRCMIPSGKLLHNYGKSAFLFGKLTISMAMFNSYVKLPQGNHDDGTIEASLICTALIFFHCAALQSESQEIQCR